VQIGDHFELAQADLRRSLGKTRGLLSKTKAYELNLATFESLLGHFQSSARNAHYMKTAQIPGDLSQHRYLSLGLELWAENRLNEIISLKERLKVLSGTVEMSQNTVCHLPSILGYGINLM
jgi:hypothetical protein